MTLTWVSCGIDYPKLVEGEADYILYASAAPWDHVPGSLLLAEAGGLLGTTEGVTYSPRDTAPPGLVAAGEPHGIRPRMPCARLERPPALTRR